MTKEGKGRTREIGPSEIPSLFTVHHQLVPGDIATQRLVRIGDQAGLAFGREFRRDCISVGAVLVRVRSDRRDFLIVDDLVRTQRMDGLFFLFAGQARSAFARQRLILH